MSFDTTDHFLLGMAQEKVNRERQPEMAISPPLPTPGRAHSEELALTESKPSRSLA